MIPSHLVKIRSGPQGPQSGRQRGVERPNVSVVEGPDEIAGRFVVQEDDASREAELVLLRAQV